MRMTFTAAVAAALLLTASAANAAPNCSGQVLPESGYSMIRFCRNSNIKDYERVHNVKLDCWTESRVSGTMVCTIKRTKGAATRRPPTP